MFILRKLSIPILTLAFAAGPVIWAFPEDLPPIRMAGIVTGWAGCGLLLASLVLMVREARLADFFCGLERMYHWHHRTGMAAYVLILAHPLILAVDARSASPDLAWQILSPLTQGWSVWMGWLSLLLLMAGLGTTFNTRIAYPLWRWLHAGLGVAVLLGLFHLVLLGIDEPVLPIISFATFILGWRLVRGDIGLAARPYAVSTVEQVADAMVEISLKPLGHPLVIEAGQFVLVAFFAGPTFRGCGESHPFTVSAITEDGTIRVGVKALGDCTRRIQSIEPGVLARVQGGFGTFLVDRPACPQLWVAGGVGITPFLALLREGPLTQPTMLLYLYRNETDAAFLLELEGLAKCHPLLSLRACATGDGSPPDPATLLYDTPSQAWVESYLCGPPGMVTAVTRVLKERGIATRHIHFENFGFR